MAARKKPTPREQRTLGNIGPVKGGLAQMLAQSGGDPEIIKAAEMVESMPGGMELLYTMAGEALVKKAGGSKKDAKKIRLYNIGGYVEQAYAKGGSVAAAAAKTKQAGRGEDSMMLHMSPDEYQVIEAMWGPAEINPNTGIGEYGFLSKIWKKVKGAVKKIFSSKIFQVVAPIALSIFAPGLGTAIGSALGAGATAAPIVGNALLRGGMSAAGGGDFMTGAITGAVSGGLGDVVGGQISKIAPGLSESTASVIGSSLAGGAGSSLTGGDFAEGAVMGGLSQMMQPTMDNLVSKGQNVFGIEDPGAGGILARRTTPTGSMSGADPGAQDLITLGAQGEQLPMSPVPAGEEGLTVFGDPAGMPAPATASAAAPGAAPGGLDMATLAKYGLPLMMAGGAGGGYEDPGAPPLPEGWNDPLPQYTMNRQFQAPDPNAYYTYGQAGAPQSGQHLFIDPRPFGGAGDPSAGPTGGLGLGANAQLQEMLSTGQPIPAQMVTGRGSQGTVRQAGYTQDPSTGNWMPPAPGLGQATGGYQEGGDRFVQGAGTGRSDDIPARLSDGEYVIDAESVALLGDGSGKSGAARLDEMRENLRKHKATNLSKGGFSHKAKTPDKYMSGGGMARLRAAVGRA